MDEADDVVDGVPEPNGEASAVVMDAAMDGAPETVGHVHDDDEMSEDGSVDIEGESDDEIEEDDEEQAADADDNMDVDMDAPDGQHPSGVMAH